MARPQQRYRGVHQRHWGSWVSEIRHPLLKTRIWLGTFETAEDAARAYDQAARIMCGPKARTNFAQSSTEPPHPDTKLLSDTLKAKLQKCNFQSLQMATKQPASKGRGAPSASSVPVTVTENNHFLCGDEWPASSSGNGNYDYDREQFAPLEDDHIEQMIEELLDYGYIELCVPYDHNASSTCN